LRLFLDFSLNFRHNSGKGRSAMDDFRVGPVPSSEPYGDRHPYGAIGRKRRRQHDDENGGQPDEPADIFEATAETEGPSPEPEERVEDYYVPSKPAPDEE